MLRLRHKFARKPEAGPAERRAHARHETDIETLCRPVSDPVELSARIMDVSLGGVRVRVGRALREGTMLRVDLPRPAGAPTSILACVMHVRRVGQAEWDAGCRFSTELSEPEVRAFGGNETPTADGDLRAWVRCAARGIIDVRELPGTEGPPATAELVNLSPAGVGLIVAAPIEPGTALLLSLKRNDDQPDCQMLACVVYQTERADGKWAIGCNFIRELSSGELDELLWASSF